MKMAQWMILFATLTTADDKAVNVTNLHCTDRLGAAGRKIWEIHCKQHFNVRFSDFKFRNYGNRNWMNINGLMPNMDAIG